MKKKVDSRVRALIENGVREHHRGLIVLVGDRGKDQVVNLHYMLSKARVKARPTVLWCYKKELGFSSHKKKRMKQVKKMMQRGLLDPDKDDPFELFVTSTKIRFTFYSETEKVLGNTFGMCVLQDFEALTPNLLARTVETVEGGGLVILLLRTMTSLRQLYSLTMDAHAKLKTEAHSKVVARFNERFILSLTDCNSCVVCDDELSILPISNNIRGIPLSANETSGSVKPAEEEELDELKQSMIDVPIVGPLLNKTKTIDQAKALLTFVEAISEKTLQSTVSLTAARGRGKSAALGLAVAAALAHDYSNVFVTSPSPENLGTFFDFLFVGFDALEYQEHLDYEILQSTNPALQKCVVRVNLFRNHRQTVQYIEPQDASKASQHAELFVIDEAAAIPLPIVKSLMGPYLVFMSSTVTGYEGTGRSLSLKLLAQLRKDGVSGGKSLREVTMEAPIRYSQGDQVEKWLYELLCLDVGESETTLANAAAHPSKCDLYWVDRNALFSRHAAAEAFLRRVMALFVSSHYKNSPNDLLMLSDAPAHELFVLLGPTKPDSTRLPDVLCAIQVSMEGSISKETAQSSMSRGLRPNGDLIPWTLSQQYQEAELTSLSGTRIVRIATNPSAQSMGYGTRAMELLYDYFAEGTMLNGVQEVSEGEDMEDGKVDKSGNSLLEDNIAPRKTIPPLLRRLSERKAERIDYIGVSYGLTQQLYSFWSKLGYKPLYIRLTANELTGEHTVIMTKETKDETLMESFRNDFRRRFASLLGFEFRSLSPGLALSILEDNACRDSPKLTKEKIRERFSIYDLRRLESYGRNIIDYHVVVDLIPTLAGMYFEKEFGELSLSMAQRAMLIALGLQRKTIETLEGELNLPASQILALLNKVIRKLSKRLREEEENAVSAEMAVVEQEASARVTLNKPLEKTLEQDLEEAADEDTKRRKEKDAALGLADSSLIQYAVAGTNKDWEEALGGLPGGNRSVSIKRSRKKEVRHGGEKKVKKSKR